MPQPKTHSAPQTFCAFGIYGGDAACLNGFGEIFELADLSPAQPVLVCHVPWTLSKIQKQAALPPLLDVLELFVFLRPAQFCAPTISGLARALDLPLPQSADDAAMTLLESCAMLLNEARTTFPADREELVTLAQIMGQNGRGWGWTPHVLAALGQPYDPHALIEATPLLKLIRTLPEYAETAPPDPPRQHPVTGDESRARLAQILTQAGRGETREAQKQYATQLTAAFAPREAANTPHVVLAEAGTGVGKTYGYLAPASVWAEKNQGTVWISTYTKNLQRQIAQDIQNLYPDATTRDALVVTRKGRENYLCLLNYAEMAAGSVLARDARVVIAAGILARWITHTKDGDINSGDFPVWLASLLGTHNTLALTDRRGECIYAACDYYHRCFIERSVRKARHARIVIANHALVMTQAARGTNDDPLPARYVFDEGHHVFDAADNLFAAHLTAQTGQELRRWILGYEGTRKSRARGLKKRLEGLLETEGETQLLIENIIDAARALPADGALDRLSEDAPKGSAEKFLVSVLQQIEARTQESENMYGAEVDVIPASAGVIAAAKNLQTDLQRLYDPLQKLTAALWTLMADQADTLSSDSRRRLEALACSLNARGADTVRSWMTMLDDLIAGTTTPDTVSWFGVDQFDSKIDDIGYYRHFADPTKAFAQALRPSAHGIVFTSATLRDTTDNESANWRVARQRTGADDLTRDPIEIAVPSPFDYAAQSRVLIVTDVARNQPHITASAYRALFTASQGGALGIFTAIQRLKAVYKHLHPALDAAHIPLYAQHMDPLDTGTLIDMFRIEENACLLGTDAVRDGVDVPGQSLRLIVFDRVPWPRASILHRARRAAFGKGAYDDRLVRLKLKQAYGRLIRRAGDKGVFVLLDSAIPSRLLDSFPVAPQRVGLAEAVQITRDFLDSSQVLSP